MARKKKEKEESGNFDLDSILDGDEYRKIEQELWSQVPFWIGTGAVSLDWAIGGFIPGFKGGIPAGKVTEIYGNESSGKSTLLDHIVREFTTKYNGVVLIGDSENSHDERRMAEIGVNFDNVRFIEKRDSKLEVPRNFALEEFFEMASSGFHKIHSADKNIPILVALDSLAATPCLQQGEDYDKTNMKERLEKSMAMSSMFPRFCSDITTNGATLIIINQIRQKPGVMFGDPDYSPGGHSKDFMFSIRIKMGNGSVLKAEEDPSIDQKFPDPVGLLCSFRVVKNKLAPPSRKGLFYLMWDSRGIQHESTFAQLLLDRKFQDYDDRVDYSGGHWAWKGDKVGRGVKGLTRAFLDNPELMEEIEYELLGKREDANEEDGADMDTQGDTEGLESQDI
jgi:recombination protein RecA